MIHECFPAPGKYSGEQRGVHLIDSSYCSSGDGGDGRYYHILSPCSM